MVGTWLAREWMGSQEKTHAPVAVYIAMTAGTNTVSWIIMAGLSCKV
jgi:hypothetical protein